PAEDPDSRSVLRIPTAGHPPSVFQNPALSNPPDVEIYRSTNVQTHAAAEHPPPSLHSTPAGFARVTGCHSTHDARARSAPRDRSAPAGNGSRDSASRRIAFPIPLRGESTASSVAGSCSAPPHYPPLNRFRGESAPQAVSSQSNGSTRPQAQGNRPANRAISAER